MSVYSNNFVVGESLPIYINSTVGNEAEVNYDIYSPVVLMKGAFSDLKTVTDAGYVDSSGSIVTQYSQPTLGKQTFTTAGAIHPVLFTLPGTTSTTYALLGLRTILCHSTEIYSQQYIKTASTGFSFGVWKLNTTSLTGTKVANTYSAMSTRQSLIIHDLEQYLPGSTFYYMAQYTIKYNLDALPVLTGGVTYAAYIDGIDTLEYYINLPYSDWTGRTIEFDTFATGVDYTYTQPDVSYGYIHPIYVQTSG